MINISTRQNVGVRATGSSFSCLNKMDQINIELDSDLGMKTSFHSQTKLNSQASENS